jgi:hypothetical protein
LEELNLEKAIEPTQRHKGAETHGLQRWGLFTRSVVHGTHSFAANCPPACAFATSRLCVDHRFSASLSCPISKGRRA